VLRFVLQAADRCTRNAIQLSAGATANTAHQARFLSAFINLELGNGQKAVEVGHILLSTEKLDSRKIHIIIFIAQGHLLTGNGNLAHKAMNQHIFTAMSKEINKELITAYYQTFAQTAAAVREEQKFNKSLEKALKFLCQSHLNWKQKILEIKHQKNSFQFCEFFVDLKKTLVSVMKIY
jgi:hypothetical protein